MSDEREIDWEKVAELKNAHLRREAIRVMEDLAREQTASISADANRWSTPWVSVTSSPTGIAASGTGIQTNPWITLDDL